MAARLPKKTLAVFKFASCDGCQLTLLDREDELLSIADAVDIACFPEASRDVRAGPYDVALVEGSITTPDDAERIKRIRRQSKCLVSIGACATAGGIQALRNRESLAEVAAAVYPRPEYLRVLATSTAIADHVTVDAELRGCPIDGRQLVQFLAAVLNGRRPALPTYSECIECKRRGTVCVMVADGVPCLGPVTQAGCGNLCPPLGRGCYGCFGPMETPNTASLANWFDSMGVPPATARDLFRTFNSAAPAFQRQGDTYDDA